MKYLRYMGEFVSAAGVIWRVEILQEADAAFDSIGSLEFPADEPLVIEWGDKSKEEVICSSVATLKIISPGDRTYEDLYSIEVGRVRLDIYRNNSLYWSGCIDTEFYEEPYEMLNGYEVSLTFSDFGVLDRLKYNLIGMRTISEILSYGVSRADINAEVDTSLMSLYLSGEAKPAELSDIKVRSDNFIDEDGEAMTLKEALEGIMQPLALRLVQRCGKIYVYDLNGLYTKGEQKQIVWDGSTQVMGVDVVYNNAKITWSTYAQSGNLMPTKCWTLPVSKQLTALNNVNGEVYGNARYFSYHYSTNLEDWEDESNSGFTLWISKEGENAQIEDIENVRFFKIVPQYDGDESEGIAIFYKSVALDKSSPTFWESPTITYQTNGVLPKNLAETSATVAAPLFKSEQVWIPPVTSAEDLLVKVSLSLLIDPRFNPFESTSSSGHLKAQKDYQDQWNDKGNFVYVPVCIKFQHDGSDDIYCWDNRDIVNAPVSLPVISLNGTFGKWRKYAETDGVPDVWGYLCYYNEQNRKKSSGVANGWNKNRPAINPHNEHIITVLENCEDGQYMPYPTPWGGKMWVEVLGKGWMIYTAGSSVSETTVSNPHDLWGISGWLASQKISYILMQLPEIEIANNVQFDQAISTDDVEYNAEINAGARELLEIDTICGTSSDGVPMARGAYFKAANSMQITEFSRAGRTTQAEELLIGTLYSQFANRHIKLSGEAEIASGGMVAYTEQNQGNKIFILAGDTQDAIADTSQAVFIELSPDEYTKEGEE